MVELIYISILLIAIAFFVVTVYICFVLKRVTNMMKTLTNTLQDVEKQMDDMKPTIQATMKESSRLVDDVSEKVQATDSVFDSVHLLGESVQTANTVLQDNIGNLTQEEMDRKIKPYVEGMKWTEAGLQLVTQWKEKDPKEKKEIMIRNQNEVMKVSGKEG